MSEKFVVVENKVLQDDFHVTSISVMIDDNTPVSMVISSPKPKTFHLLVIPPPCTAAHRLLTSFTAYRITGQKTPPFRQTVPWELQIADEQLLPKIRQIIESAQPLSLKERIKQYNFSQLTDLHFYPQEKIPANHHLTLRLYKGNLLLVSRQGEPVLFAKTPQGDLVATLTDNPLLPRADFQSLLFTGVVLDREDANEVELITHKVLKIKGKETLRKLKIGLERWANHAARRLSDYFTENFPDRVFALYHLMYPEFV